MSQNVTLLATISATQALALEALLKGATITKAASEAGVVRETVSRWVHHDPAFAAELQNARAELALQTLCALEALGMRAVGVLVEAMQNQFMHPWRFRAACALLKLIGADKAQTMPSTTAEEVQLAFQEREAALLERQRKLSVRAAGDDRPIEVADDSEPANAVPEPSPAEPGRIAPAGNGEVVEPAADSTRQAAPAAVPSADSGSEPAGCKPNGDGGLRQALINTLLKSAHDRGTQSERVSVLPISIETSPSDRRGHCHK
jgi:hypothetical protein